MKVFQSFFAFLLTAALVSGCSQKTVDMTDEINLLAEKTVRATEYGKFTNCNIAPEDLRDTKAWNASNADQDTVRHEYKAACLREVKSQKEERNRTWLAAKEERWRHRLAHRKEAADRRRTASSTTSSEFKPEAELATRN